MTRRGTFCNESVDHCCVSAAAAGKRALHSHLDVCVARRAGARMAELHALVDAPRGGRLVAAAIALVGVGLPQLFAADLPAGVRGVSTVPLGLPHLAAEAAVLHGAQRRR